MQDLVTHAIIDATAGSVVAPSAVSATSRYATPIANLPLICHVFDELAGAGIAEARVIVGANIRGELERILDFKDLAFLAVGSVIGSGIFLVPAAVLRACGGSVPGPTRSWAW